MKGCGKGWSGREGKEREEEGLGKGGKMVVGGERRMEGREGKKGRIQEFTEGTRRNWREGGWKVRERVHRKGRRDGKKVKKEGRKRRKR